MPDEPNETQELAARLLTVMDELGRHTKHRSHDSDVARMSISQIHTLHRIAAEPGMTQKTLAERLEISAAAVSIIIRDLEALKMVERKPDETDARQFNLFLTRRGRALVVQTRNRRRAAVVDLLEALPLDEQRMVVSALERAVAAKLANEPD